MIHLPIQVAANGRRWLIAGVLPVLMIASALALATPAHAGSGSGGSFEPPTTSASTWASLKAKAERQGLVPVIVSLDVGAEFPGDKSPAERAAQRASIGKARAALLLLFGGKELRNLKTLDDLPLLAFHADARDLALLNKSALVRSVSEDREFALDVPHGTNGSDAAGQASDGSPLAAISRGAELGQQLPSWWDWYRIGVDKAESYYRVNGSGQTVAILDTGVDSSHAWLKGKLVAEACFSTVDYNLARSHASGSGGCPHGRNIEYGPGAAAPCAFATICAHGTHVAHTAAGAYGVARGASIVAVQVFHRGPNGEATYYESDLVWGLNYVYNLRSTYRIAAVNLSIGGKIWVNGAYYLSSGYCDNAVTDGTTNNTYLTGWISSLKTAGIATVVAAGNDNSSTGLSYPACIANAISVGNTTLDSSGYDAVLGYTPSGSNSNQTLDLLAPGTDICSAVPSWFDTRSGQTTYDGIDCTYYGTSMATPHVAGAIAVLRQRRPTASVDQLLYALQKSGPGVYDSRNGVTRTRINLYGALAYI